MRRYYALLNPRIFCDGEHWLFLYKGSYKNSASCFLVVAIITCCCSDTTAVVFYVNKMKNNMCSNLLMTNLVSSLEILPTGDEKIL